MTKVCEPLWSGATGAFAFNATATSASTGSSCPPIWSGPTSDQIVFSSPAIENGVLFIGSDGGALYAFDATGTTNCSGTPKTCTPLRTRGTGGMVRSSPAPAGNTVFVGSEDGKLYAFGLP